ncbi:hypothetical protein [Natrialba aegyptia]|uniref:hypothetical protein n=1 Tax=Natrialba aegyptia TaxID=129789 RepID=UPI001268CF47|nr:hypothetical protein [Natrialba aegyptia]
MKETTMISEKLYFENTPDTQEFLHSFLQALETQYSYDRLKGLSTDHLEDEFDYLHNDLKILKWRLYKGDKFWRSEGDNYNEVANIARSYDLKKPTINQLHQIGWAINRIERNFDRAWRYSDDGKFWALISNIKYLFIGSPPFAGIRIDFSKELNNES